MAFPFLGSEVKRRDQVVAIDLGTRTTKAVYLQRKGDRWGLVRYAVEAAPKSERSFSADSLAEHLKTICQSLDARTKRVTLVPGADDSLLRPAEMAWMPLADMRQALKLNAASVLQQEFKDYVFDCFVLPPRSGEEGNEPRKLGQKCKVIVGGAREELVSGFQAAAKAAGLVADQIVPNLIGPANALELAYPEEFSKEVVAVVDLGFKHSTISLLHRGELKLNRVVALGGDKLTSSLAETMNVSYPDAEALKIGAPPEAETVLQGLFSPLARELRASIDFFEHQHDAAVSQVFVSGAAAASNFFIHALQLELLVPCRNWDPTRFLEILLPAPQQQALESVSSQLAVAVGAAVATF